MNGPCDDNVAPNLDRRPKPKRKGKTGMSKSVAIVSGSRSRIGKAIAVSFTDELSIDAIARGAAQLSAQES